MSIRRDKFGTSILDLPFNIALDEIPGLSRGYKYGKVSGLNTTQRAIWTAGFDYNPPPGPTEMFFASTNAGDVAGGAGVDYLQVGYVGSGFNEFTEIHCFNGQTPVPLNNPVHTINGARVLADDIDKKNLGPIWAGTGSFTSGVPSSAYTHIDSGVGQTYQAFYTVPNNKLMMVYDMIMTANEGKEGSIEMFARENSETFPGFPNAKNVFQAKNHYDIFQTTLSIHRKVPLCFGSKTEIIFKGRGKATLTDLAVEGTFVLINSIYLHGKVGL